MHDVYYGTALPPDRRPIMITSPGDRIGVPHFVCAPEKIVAIVETDAPDRNTPSRPRTRTPRRSPATSSTSSSTRSARPDPQGCCRCSPASATSPTPSWPGWGRAAAPA